MSNNEHTPGPWEIQPRGTRKTVEIFPDVEDDSGGPWIEVGGARREANARLIAAAPELLAALLEFEAVVGSLGWCAIGGTESDLFTDFYSLATSAIHKAIKG